MNRKDMKKQYSLRKIGKYVGSVVIGLSFAAVMNSTEVQAAQQPPSAESFESTDDEISEEGFTTVVTDNKTAEAIPFETKYIADDTMELNTKKEVTPGKPGLKAFKNKTFYNYETGKTTIIATTPKKVIITEPTTQVIKVGTKPTVITEKIESSIKYIKDPNRPIGSDVITESEGEDGIKKITTTYSLNEKTGEVTVKNNTTTIEKKAQDIVYKVGAQDKIQETTINHKTIYEKDDNLEVRKRKIKTPGEDGKIVTTTSYNVSLINGTPTPNTPIEKRTEPKTEVITIGTKPTVRVEDFYSEEVKFVKDLEHQKGSNPETIPGENGTKEITTTYKLDTNTGEVSELETTEKILTQPTPTVVKVPAKDKIEHIDIPIEAEYEADPMLEKGKKVDDPNHQGKLGVRTITTTYRIENGKAVEDTSTEKVTTPMEKKIIKVGTKPTVRVEEIESKEVKFEKDLEHQKGSNPETIPGENGTKEITTTYKLDTNTGEVSELETTEKILTQPTPTVVKVPAKPKVETQVLPTTIIRYEKDITKEKGSPIQMIDGVDGLKTTTTNYNVDPITGKITEDIKININNPTDTIVKVPAKDSIKEETIPFTTTYKEDSNLSVGEEVEVTPGKNGKVITTITYNIDVKSGKITESSSTQIQEPQTRVIKKGTKVHTEVETPATETPEESKPDNSTTETPTQPGTDNPATNTPEESKPGNSTAETPTQPGTDNPATETPEESKPDNSTTETPTQPGTDNPATETPGETKPDNSATETPTQPGTDNPATNTPEENKPGNSTTETPNLPEVDNPATETPEESKPGNSATETPTQPGTDNPATETPGEPTPGNSTNDAPNKPEKSKENIFTAKLADGVIVSVTYNSLGTDVNKLVAKDVDNKEVNRIKSLVRKLYPELSVVRTLELHFANKNNNEIAVPGNRTVTLALDAKGNQLKVYHVDGDNLKEIKKSSYENGMLTFETPHFSTFVIASNNILKVSKDHAHQVPQIVLPSRSIESSIQSSVDKITQLSVQKSEETKKSNKKDKSLPNTGINTSDTTILSLILMTLFGLVTRKKLSNK